MSHKSQPSQNAPSPLPEESHEVGLEMQPNSAEGSAAPNATAPPPKKTRVARRDRSKNDKNVSFSGLLKLPLELFTQIVRDLMPVDVLSLSRTSKSLRDVLMRRSSEPIWNCATENLPYPLPPCPPWLDMPQYISVVYTDACSTCGSKALPKRSKSDPEFHPVLLVRLCIGCQPVVLIPYKDIPTHIRAFVMAAYVDVYPGPGINMDNGDYGLWMEVLKTADEYKTYILGDQGVFDAWKLNKRSMIEGHSEQSHWDLIRAIKQDRERQKDDLKRQFQRGVEERLKELGWEHDIRYVGDGGWRSLVQQQPRILTDRIWSNLYPKLQTILNEARSRRLAELPAWKLESLMDLWKNQRRDLGTQVSFHPQYAKSALGSIHARLVPPLSKAVNWPHVKQILDVCPSHHDMKIQLLEKWEEIRSSTQTWQRGVESRLTKRLKGDTLFTTASDSPNAFKISRKTVSNNLSMLLRADSVFQFENNTVRYFPGGFLTTRTSPEYRLLESRRVTASSIIKGAQSFTLAREIAKMLLQHLGHPHATHLSMTAQGKRFICGICVGYNYKYAKLYDWKRLLNHYISALLDHELGLGDAIDPGNSVLMDAIQSAHHPDKLAANGPFPPIHILSAGDASRYAHDISQLPIETPWLTYRDTYVCLHCEDYGISRLSDVLTHIQSVHNIRDSEVHRDFENYELYIRQALEGKYRYMG